MSDSFVLRAPTIADAELIALLSDELGHIVDTDVMARRIADLNDRDDHHLVVDSRFRRRGVGRFLVENAIKWSAEHGASVMVVRSNVVRKESHEFYPSVGFELIKTQSVYRRVLAT